MGAYWQLELPAARSDPSRNVGSALENHPSHWLRLIGSQKAILLQIVHVHESNSGGVVNAGHDRGVISR